MSAGNLQRMMEELKRLSLKVDVEVNVKNTKVMLGHQFWLDYN